MTNGDIIRAMTDDELAEFFAKLTSACSSGNCKGCVFDGALFCTPAYKNYWLKQEADTKLMKTDVEGLYLQTNQDIGEMMTESSVFQVHTLASGESGYEYVTEKLIEYCMNNDRRFSDYIVRIDLSPNNNEHEYINVYAYSDGGPFSSYDFLADWWEGQKTIQIVGLRKLEDIFETGG